MFTLELYDRNGAKLQLGDLVRISNGRKFVFYTEIKYLPEECAISPFHTFSFHSVEKVDEVPEGCTQSQHETRFKVWYNKTHDEDLDPKSGKDYLMSWRSCELALEQKMFRIKIQEQ